MCLYVCTYDDSRVSNKTALCLSSLIADRTCAGSEIPYRLSSNNRTIQHHLRSAAALSRFFAALSEYVTVFNVCFTVRLRLKIAICIQREILAMVYGHINPHPDRSTPENSYPGQKPLHVGPTSPS